MQGLPSKNAQVSFFFSKDASSEALREITVRQKKKRHSVKDSSFWARPTLFSNIMPYGVYGSYIYKAIFPFAKPHLIITTHTLGRGTMPDT